MDRIGKVTGPHVSPFRTRLIGIDRNRTAVRISPIADLRHRVLKRFMDRKRIQAVEREISGPAAGVIGIFPESDALVRRLIVSQIGRGRELVTETRARTCEERSGEAG